MRMCFVFFKTNPKNQITEALIIETEKGRAETSQHERSLLKVKSPKTSISKFNLLLLKATLHRLTSSLHSSTPHPPPRVLPQERYLPDSTLNLQQKASSNHMGICGASDTGMGRDREELEWWGGKGTEGGDNCSSHYGKL